MNECHFNSRSEKVDGPTTVPTTGGRHWRGLEELAVIVEAAGKSLLPGPFLPTVMASAIVGLAAAGPVRTELLNGFAAVTNALQSTPKAR